MSTFRQCNINRRDQPRKKANYKDDEVNNKFVTLKLTEVFKIHFVKKNYCTLTTLCH